MRSLTLEKLGTSKKGRNITLIKLTNNNNMQVEVVNYGAKIVSVKLQNGFEIYKDTMINGQLGNFEEEIWSYELFEEGDGVLFRANPNNEDLKCTSINHARKSFVLTDENEIITECSGNTEEFLFNLNGIDSESYDHEFEISENHCMFPNSDCEDNNSMIHQVLFTASTQFSIGAKAGRGFNTTYCFGETDTVNQLNHILRVISSYSRSELNIFSSYRSFSIRSSPSDNRISLRMSSQDSITHPEKTLSCTNMANSNESTNHMTIYRFSEDRSS